MIKKYAITSHFNQINILQNKTILKSLNVNICIRKFSDLFNSSSIKLQLTPSQKKTLAVDLYPCFIANILLILFCDIFNHFPSNVQWEHGYSRPPQPFVYIYPFPLSLFPFTVWVLKMIFPPAFISLIWYTRFLKLSGFIDYKLKIPVKRIAITKLF